MYLPKEKVDTTIFPGSVLFLKAALARYPPIPTRPTELNILQAVQSAGRFSTAVVIVIIS